MRFIVRESIAGSYWLVFDTSKASHDLPIGKIVAVHELKIKALDDATCRNKVHDGAV